MKLAMIDSSGVGRCLICSWDWKVPSHRRGKGRGLKTLILLTKEERVKLLEERILAHLRDTHDRIMLIREEVVPRVINAFEDSSQFRKTYYCGRSMFRG